MNMVFASCLATNRLPDDSINDAANCGRCGEPLLNETFVMPRTHPGQTAANDLPLVIDFWVP